MSTPILATKLYIPSPRPTLVRRPRLSERLNEGLQGKLTLISAPAGYGKTTLVSTWLAESFKRNTASKNQTAWLSLDEGDNDPTRFLIYLVAALQTVAPQVGAGVLAMLHSPQPPPSAVILTALLNQITTIPDSFVLVLDDYHVIEAQAVAQALTFLVEHLPPQLHLVIATREDPQLPLARLRVRGQLTEVRAADLRFTPAEAADFLNQVMGLQLAADEIAALESRTEGWIAGLQLAALSLQGQQDVSRKDAGGFIQSFTGSHRFVLDYLVEEVLHQQPASIQRFLLRTAILNRLCGPLCEAVLDDPTIPGQATLEYLEQANLFIVPLDNERRWYRYHHLFAELLRQRLQQSTAVAVEGGDRAELHKRASQWLEDNQLAIEAFHHAAAANDVERAERLIAGQGMPLHFRGAVVAILDWLASLPTSVLQARPWLWWRHASLLLVNGHTVGVEEKLNAAEAALPSDTMDESTRNLIGRIATARAVLALTRYQPQTILVQARRALEYLHPSSLSTRANVNWAMGIAHFFQGERAAAQRAYREAIALAQPVGDTFTTILATIGLGQVQEGDNQLHLAAQTYRSVLQLAGDQPMQIINEAHLGLARIHYEWNDLVAAEEHGRASLHLARQYESVIDRFILSELFLVRLKLAQGDVVGASTLLAQSEQAARQRGFVHRIPDVAAAQVLILLGQGHFAAAAQLAQMHPLPLVQARVHLAQGNAGMALAVLEPVRQQAEVKDLADERLKVLILQALARQALGEKERALPLLGEALLLAAPGDFVRLFVDEGAPLAQLLSAAAAQGIMVDYVGKLLTAFAAEVQRDATQPIPPQPPASQPLVDPLSEREIEVLRLIAQGLSNHEICQRLFLALSTVKGHNQRIFDKLQVQRRTEAVARARALGVL